MQLWKILAVAAMAISVGAGAADAKPKGLRGDDVGKKLFNFNVLVYPGEWSQSDDVCNNNGNRVFFQSDGKGGDVGVIDWSLYETGGPTTFDITDCDGTTDGDVNVVVNQSIDIYVAVRLVGPATSSVDLVCEDLLSDGSSAEDVDICIVDSTTINKGNSFTKIMKSILDEEFDHVLWDLDFSSGAKNLQVWVLEDLSRQ